MTYELAFGNNWQGLLADGTLNMEAIAQKYLKHYGYEMRDCHTAVVDMISVTRREHWVKELSEQRCTGATRLRVCRPSCSLLRQRPVCENYVLSASTKETSPLMAELVNTDPKENRFLVLTLSNCKDLKECTKEVIDEFGFVERQKQAYCNYNEFSESAHELIEKSISYFEAPCVRLLEYLEGLGFSGDLETYG